MTNEKENYNVVSDEVKKAFEEYIKVIPTDYKSVSMIGFIAGWNACKSHMLKGV